ncbi:MAG: ribosomal L7Ae/L30e/S12e/Gadd45 family protein [Clostridia bacterium]|nr:ribosomal L7Ae/L30e/S12e/Gadd45 family protein [Clostridia bacterium]
MISDATNKHLQVGFKQSLKAIEEGRGKEVLLALDCDEKISAPIRKAASDKGVKLVEVPTMKELGTQCGIEVSASCAVVLNF